MEFEELDRRLKTGEEVVCPDCDMMGEDGETCWIICCEDPFVGYEADEIGSHADAVSRFFFKSNVLPREVINYGKE